MPEFMLNEPESPHPFYELDDFARGYVEAAFFTNCDTGDANEFRANELGVDALTPESVENIRRDCAEFQERAASLLEAAYERGYEEAQAGRDFWFTRQGHGVGFTDRKILCADESGEYEALTARMIESRDDSEKWNALLYERGKIEEKTLAYQLASIARTFGEVYPYFGDDNQIHL